MTEDQWIPFFEYLTSASAAILAIAFLTFQVKAQQWRNDPLRQPVAITTLTELATPVFFGLIFLMPDHPWRTAGLIVGSLGYAVALYHVIVYWNYGDAANSFDRWQLAAISISLVTFGGLLFWPSLQVKASLCVWMIFSGLSEAWIFLRPPDREVIDAGGKHEAASDTLERV